LARNRQASFAHAWLLVGGYDLSFSFFFALTVSRYLRNCSFERPSFFGSILSNATASFSRAFSLSLKLSASLRNSSLLSLPSLLVSSFLKIASISIFFS